MVSPATYAHVMPQAPIREGRGGPGRPRLGELLVTGGFITPAQLEDALREQSSWGGRLGQNLLDAGLVDERTLASAIASQLQLHVVDLDREPPPAEVTGLVPVQIAERYGLVAIAVDGPQQRVLVACVDPTSDDAMSEVRRTTGLAPFACVATASQIDRVVRRNYYGEAEPIPTPDPRLDVSRRAITPAGRDDAPERLAPRAGGLMELLRRERRSRS